MLALDTNERFEVKIYPEDPKSTEVFVFRYRTAREYKTALKVRQIREEEDAFSDVAYDALFDAIRVNLVDWRGLAEPFSIDRLEDMVTTGEAVSLYYKSLQGGKMDVEAKNESGSASDASSEPSADIAGQENV